MKKQIIIACILLITLVLIVNISAYQSLCLTKGEVPPFSSETNYTCTHDLCTICVTDSLHQAHPSSCKDILVCKHLSEIVIPLENTTNSSENLNETNSSNSTNPNENLNETNSSNSTNTSVTNNSSVNNITNITNPIITIEPFKASLGSPLDGKIYSKTVLFNVTSEREVSVYYKEEDGEWKMILTGKKSYLKKLSFNEGFHNLTIKIVDNNYNERNFTASFYVDNSKPKIRKTGPSKGYTDGSFDLEFMETNPQSLVFKYGNSITGYRDYNVHLENCFLGRISRCNVKVNLSDYNQQNVYYWFTLRDVSGNSVETKHIQLSVDATSPVINNPDSIFKLDSKSKTVTFNLNITELNLASVSYLDSSQRTPKWNLLCPKLTKGYCSKKLTFVRGTHDIEVKVLDKAGNSVTQLIEFDV